MSKHSVGRSMIALLLVISMCISMNCVFAESEVLTEEQRNATAMLNYITVLTQETNASQNSRLFMENAYTSLINNTYPNSVDSRTLSQLTGLLDTMEEYRMVAVKRERLQFIYEQNQSQAIRAAVPNPLSILSAVQSVNPKQLAMSLVYMAVDSVSSYMAYTSEANLQFIKDGWALDDEASKALHESRKGTFSYMMKMVKDFNIPGDLTLTETAVEEFVDWKNNDNVISRIRFLESNKETYQYYGGYWLTLAESYFSNGDNVKCLEAIREYEALGTRIFRRDYEYANILPLVIAAANEVLSETEYIAFADEYAQKILDNSDHKDWALRYFVAQTYVDLGMKTQDNAYLENAHSILVDNVNYLVSEQRTMNSKYIAPVQDTPTPKDATKEEKTQISNYNKMLKENRKTELMPVSEPLLLNCELLYALSDKLDISESKQLEIDGILHPKGEALFLMKPLDQRYWFAASTDESEKQYDIVFNGTSMIIPVEYINMDSTITVTITEDASPDSIVLSDWLLEKVERVNESDPSSYQALYTSKSAHAYFWKPDSTVSIEIVPKNGIDMDSYRFVYSTSGTKDNWYDYLKVWEGQKNNWYDYLKVWENSVVFERVE